MSTKSEETNPDPGSQRSHGQSDGAAISPELVLRLKHLVERLIHPPYSVLECEDCLQEALLRLWQTTRDRPGQSLCFYLTACRFSVQEYLKRGRSLDSPKRCSLRISLTFQDDEERSEGFPLLLEDTDPAQQAGAADAQDRIMARLGPAGKLVFEGLLQGMTVCEIGRELKTSHSAVCRTRARIQAAARQVGLRPEAAA